MISRMGAICLLIAGLAMTSVSHGQFTDGFESYAVGNLPPQGGWMDFGGSQPITVSTLQAHTGTKSMRLSEGTDTLGGTSTGYGSDVFKNFAPAGVINAGMWNFSYWQFMESSVDSVAFMYISSGRLPATFQSGLDLRGDAINQFANGTSLLIVQDIAGQPTLVAPAVPLVTGRWVEHSMAINLGTNMVNYSYDGLSRYVGTWDTTPGDGVTLGGLNFWMQLGNANGVNAAVYYDDFSLSVVPEPVAGIFALVGCALLSLVRRK